MPERTPLEEYEHSERVRAWNKAHPKQRLPGVPRNIYLPMKFQTAEERAVERKKKREEEEEEERSKRKRKVQAGVLADADDDIIPDGSGKSDAASSSRQARSKALARLQPALGPQQRPESPERLGWSTRYSMEESDDEYVAAASTPLLARPQSTATMTGENDDSPADDMAASHEVPGGIRLFLNNLCLCCLG